MLQIFHLIQSQVTLTCRLSHEILASKPDQLSFVHEYNKRWNGFVASAVKLDRVLEEFAEALNRAYENLFQGHPIYPRFSIYRMMTLTWRREVFNKVQGELLLSFSTILKSHLQSYQEVGLQKKNNLSRRKSKESDLNSSNSPPLEISAEEPKLLTMVELPKLETQTSEQLMKEATTMPPEFYESVYDCNEKNFQVQMSSMDRLLMKIIIAAFTDISSHEFTVHYLKSSKVQLDAPFQKLSETVIGDIKQHFKTQIERLPNAIWADLSSDLIRSLDSILPACVQVNLVKK